MAKVAQVFVDIRPGDKPSEAAHKALMAWAREHKEHYQIIDVDSPEIRRDPFLKDRKSWRYSWETALDKGKLRLAINAHIT